MYGHSAYASMPYSALPSSLEHYIVQDLTFTDTVNRTRVLTRGIVQQLEFTEGSHPVEEASVVQTINFNDSNAIENPIYNAVAQSMGFSDFTEYMFNNKASLVQHLLFAQEVAFRLLQGTVTQAITFDQEIWNTFYHRFSVQQELTISQVVSYILFEAQHLNQSINFSQTVVGRILGLQVVEQSLNFNHLVGLQKILHQHICQCIHFEQNARRAIEATVTQTLTFNQLLNAYYFIVQELEFTQTVTTNAVAKCCGEYYYIPDKLIQQFFTFSQEVLINHNRTRAIVQSIVFRNSVIYWID